MKNPLKSLLPGDDAYWRFVGPLATTGMWLSISSSLLVIGLPALVSGDWRGLPMLIVAGLGLVIAGRYVNIHYAYLQQNGYLDALKATLANRETSGEAIPAGEVPHPEQPKPVRRRRKATQ